MGLIIVIGRQQSLYGCQCLCMPSKAVAEETADWNKISKIVIQLYFKKLSISSPLDSKRQHYVEKQRH